MTTVDVPIFKYRPDLSTPVDAAHLNGWGAAIKANADAAEAGAVAAGAATDTVMAAKVADVASLTRGALSATYAQPAGGTVVVWGDSFTAFTDGVAGTATYRNCAGYWTWADVLTQHRLDLVFNAGIPGQGSADILARWATDVAAYSPSWVVINAGNNDLTDTTRVWTTTRDNVVTMINLVHGIGARAVVLNIPPRNGMPAFALGERAKFNKWLRDYSTSARGVHMVDTYGPMLDPAADGVLASLTNDGAHPNNVAAGRLGRAVASVINTLVPPRDICEHSISDPLLLSTNPYLTGTSGTAGAGVTGSVATGWTVKAATGSVTATTSKVARTDGKPGYWQQITNSTAGTAITLVQENASANVAWTPGVTQVYAICEFETDADFALTNSSGRFDLTIDSYSTTYSGQGSMSDFRWVPPSAWAAEARIPSGVLRTPVFTIPAAANLKILAQVVLYGTGTFRVGRIALHKVA